VPDRGWVGAFVTTGFFSEQAQREVLADPFPLLMLNGRHESVVNRPRLPRCGERRLRPPALESLAGRGAQRL